jgi:putative addiction module component (TIGR02574 family)
MRLADFPAIQALSTEEKILLIEELILSVSTEDDTVREEERETLDNRWNRYLKDPASALTLEQLKAKMAKVLE